MLLRHVLFGNLGHTAICRILWKKKAGYQLVTLYEEQREKKKEG